MQLCPLLRKCPTTCMLPTMIPHMKEAGMHKHRLSWFLVGSIWAMFPPGKCCWFVKLQVKRLPPWPSYSHWASRRLQGQKPLQMAVIWDVVQPQYFATSPLLSLEHESRLETEQALCAVSDSLTFVVCFSLMIILDNSTTHIGIVALTEKEADKKTGFGHCCILPS